MIEDITLEEMTGGGDFLMIPDPKTFRVLPWAKKTGWILADIYFPNGKPVPFSTRQILRNAVTEVNNKGYEYCSGLEIEFHLFKLEDPKLMPNQAGQPPEPPEVSLLAHGFQYLTEQRMDELDPYLETLREHLTELELPLRTLEVEFGPQGPGRQGAQIQRRQEAGSRGRNPWRPAPAPAHRRRTPFALAAARDQMCSVWSRSCLKRPTRASALTPHSRRF